uniref:Uncharacterized protein n=1 Tax=Anguilla anguilla TaxID=7936 RepID=A0A0E9VT61_ANGAN
MSKFSKKFKMNGKKTFQTGNDVIVSTNEVNSQ